MRVKIKQDPKNPSCWDVYSAIWFGIFWEYRYSFVGDDSKQRALAYAAALKHPVEEELK